MALLAVQLPTQSVIKAVTQHNPRIKLSKEAKATAVRASTVFLLYLSTAYVCCWSLYRWSLCVVGTCCASRGHGARRAVLQGG